MEEDKTTNSDGDNQQSAGQLVDDVRSPERPSVRSIKVDDVSDDPMAGVSTQDEIIQSSEPVASDPDQRSTDIEQKIETSGQTGVAQDPQQESDTDIQASEPTEPAPTPELDEKASSTQTGDFPENGDETSSGQADSEDDIQTAASVPEPEAPAGKQPGHKTSVGTLIVVITVALALIALAVVSYVMINNSSVDESNSPGSNTSQQENQTETPAEASQDVSQASSEIDQTISELDGLDATTFDDSSLSDSTLGL